MFYALIHCINVLVSPCLSGMNKGQMDGWSTKTTKKEEIAGIFLVNQQMVFTKKEKYLLRTYNIITVKQITTK